jgi:hypothetical protein
VLIDCQILFCNIIIAAALLLVVCQKSLEIRVSFFGEPHPQGETKLESAMNNPDLRLSHIPGKGRGVTANKRFSKGELIEEDPVIELPDPEWQELEKTALKDYYFVWTECSTAIPLGNGALLNYSETPNAEAIRNLQSQSMAFVALRNIEPGEEITIDYNSPPWFKVVR